MTEKVKAITDKPVYKEYKNKVKFNETLDVAIKLSIDAFLLANKQCLISKKYSFILKQ